MRIGKYVLAGISGVVLVAGLVCATHILQDMSQSGREIHLIPYGYRGPVVIFVDEPNGQPPRYEDSAKVYNIPSNGILKTQMKLPTWYSARYYYVDREGHRHELEAVQDLDMVSDGDVHIYKRVDGIADRPRDSVTGLSLGQGRYIAYFVAAKGDDLDSLFRVQMSMVDGDKAGSGMRLFANLATDTLAKWWRIDSSGRNKLRTRALFFELSQRVQFLKMTRDEISALLGTPNSNKRVSTGPYDAEVLEDHMKYYVNDVSHGVANDENRGRCYVDFVFPANSTTARAINIRCDRERARQKRLMMD